MFFDYISGKSRPRRKYREEVMERKDSGQDYEFRETFHLTTNENHFREGRIKIPTMSYLLLSWQNTDTEWTDTGSNFQEEV